MAGTGTRTQRAYFIAPRLPSDERHTTVSEARVHEHSFNLQVGRKHRPQQGLCTNVPVAPPADAAPAAVSVPAPRPGSAPHRQQDATTRRSRRVPRAGPARLTERAPWKVQHRIAALPSTSAPRGHPGNPQTHVHAGACNRHSLQQRSREPEAETNQVSING